jgi:hypothetical protein
VIIFEKNMQREASNMEARKDNYKAEYKNITVRTSDGTTLKGKVNIGIRERVSDLFTKPERPFIIMLNSGNKDDSERVLIVNKDHIVWAEPEE